MHNLDKLIKNNWQIIALFIVSSFIVWPLFLSGYFSHHDDLQVMRIFEMRKCLEDLQIPCRWVPDMGFGNGFPLYNYYSAFPYYLGAILSYIFGFIGSAKALFFVALFSGGFGMYLLVKGIYGDKNVALLGAVLYTFAPYRSLDSYVRGALAESFALSIVPFVFYFILRLSRKNSFLNFFYVVISLGLMLMTHNIMTMFFLPILIIWSMGLFIRHRKNQIIAVLTAFVLAFGIASFFLLPAFIEKDLVQTDSLIRGDLNFRVHYVAVPQLFVERDWGYGASVFGPNDSLSFQIGWPHWWLVIISFVFFTLLLFKRKIKASVETFSVILFGLVFCGAILMTHNLSAFIWEKIELLQFTQFPWRFLSLIIFSTSLVGVYWIDKLMDRWKFINVISICILTILLNVAFFKPEHFFLGMTDEQKLSGNEWTQQQKASILDYLPKKAVEPRENAPIKPIILKGQSEITNYEEGTDWFTMKVDVVKDSVIEFPIFDFPNWTVSVDGKIANKNPRNHIGRIEISLSAGNYNIEGVLKNTITRNIANLITVFSLLCLVGIYFYDRKKKIFS